MRSTPTTAENRRLTGRERRPRPASQHDAARRPRGPLFARTACCSGGGGPRTDAPFAALNADPAVMEFFPHLLTPVQSDRLASHGDRLFDRFGYGLWAVEVPDTKGSSASWVSLRSSPHDPFPDQPFPFAPTVEVGWRLAREAWGQGYAPEAARECLHFGFEVVGLDEIVSFTSSRQLPVPEGDGEDRDAPGRRRRLRPPPPRPAATRSCATCCTGCRETSGGQPPAPAAPAGGRQPVQPEERRRPKRPVSVGKESRWRPGRRGHRAARAGSRSRSRPSTRRSAPSGSGAAA